MMDTLVNVYPALVVCCVALSALSAVIACVTGWCLFKPDAPDESVSERDEEIDKQIADLKTAQRRTGRGSRTISVKCQRLERRVKQLEQTTGEKQ